MSVVVNFFRSTAVATAAVVFATGIAQAEPDVTAQSPAERIFASAPERLLQIRTLVTTAGTQAVIGSGFLVTGDGLAVTNYHVVSQVALEPNIYQLEYIAADASRGKATLLAIDLADDLAVVRLDQHDAPAFVFDETTMSEGLLKGERLYSMGNPLDLGFTVVEGSYSGLVERSYNERIHFTGALNPGMSGGPTVNAQGRVVGVNVAKQIGGELVSFLVPARFAARLLKRAQDEPPPDNFRVEIGRQLALWQGDLYRAIAEREFRAVAFGPYEAPESTAPWFTCWAQTNAGAVPKPRASINSTSCRADSSLFVANDLTTGGVWLSHSYVRTVDLNRFQFANFLTWQSRAPEMASGGRRWHAPQRCREDFVTMTAAQDRPPMRVVWCARAYRDFAGLYDVSVAAVTEDRDSEALVSRLGLQAVAYDDAVALTRRFLGAVQWKP